jgi:GDPmannose 4,6-dehydratase
VVSLASSERGVKRALITGVSGMDGSHLADLLVAKGYEVHGIVRRSSSLNTQRIEHLYHDPHEDSSLRLHFGDVTDADSINRILRLVKPDEVYHLAAMSHVRVSFDLPVYTADTTGLGTLRILNALRDLDMSCRFYNAGSSEMFGSSPPPQSETTTLHPRSPYGCAKVFGFHASRIYREAYGMHVVNGILFNHTSERRGETFVTRKVSRAVGRIIAGTQKKLYLGNLSARRDFGYAPDYVEAMWQMMQTDKPDDYVIGTGETHSIEELVELAFSEAELDWHKFVEIDPTYYRAAEVDVLLADAEKARHELGWSPRTKFKEIVRRMVQHDVQLAHRECQG